MVADASFLNFSSCLKACILLFTTDHATRILRSDRLAEFTSEKICLKYPRLKKKKLWTDSSYK